MRIASLLLAGVLLSPIEPGVARAADEGLPPSDAVTLEDALRLLRDKSPRSLAERTQVDVAAADVVGAHAAPNPSLDYQGTRLRSGTNTGAADVDETTVELPVLIFGQRKERVRAAEAGVRLAESRVEASLEERARELRDLFYSLLARQEKIGVLEEARDDLRRVARVIEGRASAGDKSRYDALKIEVETRSTEAALVGVRAEREELSGKLAALIGFPGWHPHAQGDLRGDAVDTSDPKTLWEEAQAHRASIEVARRAETAAAESVTLARRERLPVPSIVGGWVRTRDADSDSAVAGVSVPLPIFDRGRGALARATAEQSAAERELLAATAEARTELDRALAVLATRREALRTLEEDVMTHLPELRTMSEAAYREGQGGIVDLLDSFRSMTDSKLAHLDGLEAVKLAENDLLFLTGRIAGSGP